MRISQNELFSQTLTFVGSKTVILHQTGALSHCKPKVHVPSFLLSQSVKLVHVHVCVMCQLRL